MYVMYGGVNLLFNEADLGQISRDCQISVSRDISTDRHFRLEVNHADNHVLCCCCVVLCCVVFIVYVQACERENALTCVCRCMFLNLFLVFIRC